MWAKKVRGEKLPQSGFVYLAKKMKFVIISDRKIISSWFSHSLSGLRFLFNHLITLKILKNTNGSILFKICRLYFQIQQKSNHVILDSPNKPKIPSKCMFPVSNPHDVPILNCVPSSTVIEAHQNIAP